MAAVDAQPFRHETCRLAAHVICSRREPDPATQIYTARCQHKKPEPEPVWCMCRMCMCIQYVHVHAHSNALKSLRLYCKCNLHSCIVTDGGRGRRGYWVIVDYWRVTVSPTPSCLQMVWLTSQQSSSSSSTFSLLSVGFALSMAISMAISMANSAAADSVAFHHFAARKSNKFPRRDQIKRGTPP